MSTVQSIIFNDAVKSAFMLFWTQRLLYQRNFSHIVKGKLQSCLKALENVMLYEFKFKLMTTFG